MIAFPCEPEQLLFHRAPILCLDVVRSGSAERAVAEGAGREWEGALIEGLAQTAGVLNAVDAMSRGVRAGLGMLVGVRGFSIRRLPRAGERVTYEVALIRRLAPLTLVHGAARAGAESLAEGELKFYAGEAP